MISLYQDNDNPTPIRRKRITSFLDGAETSEDVSSESGVISKYKQPEKEQPPSVFERLQNGLKQLPFYVDPIINYSKQIDQDARMRNQIRNINQQKPIWDYNEQYGDNQPIIKAANGAQVRTGSDESAQFRIDNGELIMLPDGKLEKAQGSSKKTDDIATILPQGTKIFSNTLKPVNSKHTFAKLASKHDYSEELKKLENPYTSLVSRTTAERMLQRKQKSLDSLFKEQQALNGDSSGEMSNAHGGVIMNEDGQFQEGGQIDFVRAQTTKPMKNFEQRMYNPSSMIHNSDGSTSTHKMTSWESNGKYYAAPTVVQRNGTLEELNVDDAIDYAMKSGEFKEFKTDKEAQEYAENGYKKGTPMEAFAYGGELKTGRQPIPVAIPYSQNPYYESTNDATVMRSFPRPLVEGFEHGGMSYASGGPVAPIYVTDKNDPRLTEYNDRLNTYNNSVIFNKLAKEEIAKATSSDDADARLEKLRELYPMNDSYTTNSGKPKVLAKRNWTDRNSIWYEDRFAAPTNQVLYQEPPVVRKTPSPLNPTAPQQRTTGVPFLAPETTKQDTFLTEIKDSEWYDNGKPLVQKKFTVTPKPVAKTTTSSSSDKPMANIVRNAQTGWDTPMVRIKFPDGTQQLVSPSEYDKWAKQNPNHEKHFEMGGEVMYEDDNFRAFKDGGIHINPKNKGKFTSWAKSHGMGVQEASSHVMANKGNYSSATVKRANFAKNAAKWHHEDGGYIHYDQEFMKGGTVYSRNGAYTKGSQHDIDEEEINRLKSLGYKIKIIK